MTFVGMSRSWIQYALALLLTSLPAIAGDVAILRNGFSIRHERRTVIGLTTRLYLGSDNTSYVDVPTADIDHFEQDLTPAPAPATGKKDESKGGAK